MQTRQPCFSRLRGLILLVLACCAPSIAPAQAPTNPTGDDNQRAIVYRIATNDRIRVGVFQEPDLDIIARVDMKGTVNLPLLGQIKVQNLTINDAEKIIENAYRDGRYLRSPQVTITVEEYAPREVSIQGQVRNPARYTLPIEQTMTVLELVTRAGGFTDTARGTAVSVTRIKDDGTKEVFSVDVESLIKGKNRATAGDNSLILLPGDIVYVPERFI
jgi:polysaccharide export outer membrane protein